MLECANVSQESYEELMTKEVEMQAIMLNGEDMLARCCGVVWCGVVWCGVV